MGARSQLWMYASTFSYYSYSYSAQDSYNSLADPFHLITYCTCTTSPIPHSCTTIGWWHPTAVGYCPWAILPAIHLQLSAQRLQASGSLFWAGWSLNVLNMLYYYAVFLSCCTVSHTVAYYWLVDFTEHVTQVYTIICVGETLVNSTQSRRCKYMLAQNGILVGSATSVGLFKLM